MYVHVPQTSRNAKKLSEQLVQVVRDAKKGNRKMSYMDVCQALRLTGQTVREELGGMSTRTQTLIVIGILLAMTLVGILMALFGH